MLYNNNWLVMNIIRGKRRERGREEGRAEEKKGERKRRRERGREEGRGDRDKGERKGGEEQKNSQAINSQIYYMYIVLSTKINSAEGFLYFPLPLCIHNRLFLLSISYD